MQFKVDENLPVEVAELLRQAGYDATTVVEQHLDGSLFRGSNLMLSHLPPNSMRELNPGYS